MAVPDAAGVHAIRWTGSTLELLDQRLLPAHEAYVTCRSAPEVAQAIRDMVVRGAPAIGCAAAFGIALDVMRGAPREDACAVLARSRPTAVNLFWAIERMRHCASPLDEALAILHEDVQVNRSMGRHGAALLPQHATVLTYCNTGALATAGHGTALGVVRSARRAGKRIEVIACETRPYLQGARLTAWECQRDAIPVTLIADNMAGHVLAQGRVDAVLVGADRVAANGDVANKIGTYTLAVLAERHGIPFYVVAPRSTFDPDTPSGRDIPIEERAADEMTGYAGARWAPENVRVYNPAFDVTPAQLVTALVCEHGVVMRPDRARLQALAPVAGAG